MLSIGKVNKHKVLTIRVHGKLTVKDYKEAMPTCEVLLNKHGSLRFYIELDHFTGFEFGAAWEEIKFDAKHIKQYGKTAVVGNNIWQKWLIKISSWFVKAPVKFFYKHEAKRAKDWVNAD